MRIKATNLPERGEVGIERMSVTYIQQADALQDQDDDQSLTVEGLIEMPSDDEKDKFGWFFRLNTGETGWTIDSAEEMTDLMEDFEERLLKKSITDEQENM